MKSEGITLTEITQAPKRKLLHDLISMQSLKKKKKSNSQ